MAAPLQLSRVTCVLWTGTAPAAGNHLPVGAPAMRSLPSRRSILSVLAAAPVVFDRLALAATRSIDETGFLTLGGIDQWVGIQGSDLGNPVILYLHGGPGEAQSPFLKEFTAWEAAFTVVNWDQRGPGKTFGHNGPSTPDMTLDQMTQDAIEVAHHALRRLGKRKIILVGQSWGAALGVHVVKRRVVCAGYIARPIRRRRPECALGSRRRSQNEPRCRVWGRASAGMRTAPKPI
jgi:pimeloyl-ACP methyl ester carboxylesterase